MNKVTTQFDIPELYSFYETNNNYKILNLGGQTQTCILFFSGNDLYFPNTTEEFIKTVVKRDRYEWESSASDPTKRVVDFASKIIFIRDVKKQWYIEGINSKLNTIEKLYKFLKKECENFKVVCVGVSAGGFGATLFGCLLNASRVYNFSGQFTLMHHFETEEGRANNPTVIEYFEVEEKKKYYKLHQFIENSEVPIFYFYPAKCPSDIKQYNCVKGLKNLYEFAFDSNRHGETCFYINLLKLISFNSERLIKLHNFYRDRIIDPLDFSIKVSGFIPTISSKYFLRYLNKKFIKIRLSLSRGDL